MDHFNYKDGALHAEDVALAEIARMTGLRFVETTGRASITYLNDGDRAHTQSSASGSTKRRALSLR